MSGDQVPVGDPSAVRVRFSIGTLMVLVLASTLVVALFFQLVKLSESIGSGLLGGHGPAVLVLAIVLTAVALGCWRGASLDAIGFQISTCCALALVAIGFHQAGWYRPLIYWFQGVFALTIVTPLVGRRLSPRARPPWVDAAGQALFLSGCNLLLVLVGTSLQLFLFELIPAFL